MNDDIVNCPKCGCEIQLSKAFAESVRKQTEQEIEKRVQERSASELKRLKDISEEEYRTRESLLRDQLNQNVKWLNDARERERKLMDRSRELEKEKQEMDLEIGRKTDEIRKNIEKESSERFGQKYAFELKERDKKISDLTRNIRDLEQQASQGSQQLQGAVLQEDVEEILRQAFPRDSIEPVSTGQKGADIIQRVESNTGRSAGIILWECKRTRNWSDSWIDKLKEDRREKNADEAVLVTTTLRKDVKDFDTIDGIVVVTPGWVVALAAILRTHVIGLSRALSSNANRSDKKELLYAFITSRQFQDAARAVAEPLRELQESIQSEKRAMNRIWKCREAQVLRAVSGLVCLYGPMQGLTGGAIPAIKELELSPEPEALSSKNASSEDDDKENG